MREIKFRFTFKDGNFIAKRYMTLDELLDSNFTLEQMEESINSESNIFDIEDYPDYEVFKDEYTGLKDKNGLTKIYGGDIIDENGLVKGNIYEINEMDKRETDTVIQGFGTETWCETVSRAILLGCRYSE